MTEAAGVTRAGRTPSPLVLTGGPAAGKSTTARRLAEDTPGIGQAAFIDVDDVRQLVVAGGLAPWDGEGGVAQQELGVRNACALATNFLAAGIAVTIADVLDAATVQLYRRLLPGVVVVRLRITFDEARRRALTRPVFLTDAEFTALHDQQAAPLAVDHELDVTRLDVDAQVASVRELWLGTDVGGGHGADDPPRTLG